jgi:hypothetical protein
LGVLRDSRNSNFPRLVGTMKAIVGKAYHYGDFRLSR